MLFFGYFSCLIVVFTSVAVWLIGSFNYSTLEKHHHHHPRPTIDQTITSEELAPLHLQQTIMFLPLSITNARYWPVSATTIMAMATRWAMPPHFGMTQEVSLSTDPAHG